MEKDTSLRLLTNLYSGEAVTNEFDTFRSAYPTLSFAQLKEYNENWYKRYPTQIYFDKDFVKQAFTFVEQANVVELGGYQGELAYAMFQEHPELQWVNMEIIPHKPVEGLEKFQYKEVVLERQFWEDESVNGFLEGSNVFIISDTLEHFADSEVVKIFKKVREAKISLLVLKTQCKEFGQLWHFYNGSHLMQFGRYHLRELLKGFGYECVLEQDKPNFEWQTVWRMVA